MTPPVPPAPSGPARPIDLTSLAGDAFARACLIRLRTTPDPEPLDYSIAALGLRIAQRLVPDDVELIRLELQAWTAAGSEDRALEAAGRVLERDPLDTVLQLRLLTSKIRRLQDARQRLSLYDRLLGKQGEALDASIRSRLALDSALLLRETGDEAGFVDRLTLATTLDPANKDAAALYCTYFLDRTSDPVERAELLAIVILADPNDQSAHANLARELLRQGAYAGAKRFFERVKDIAASASIDPTVDDMLERYLVAWMADGDEAALNQLKALENLALTTIRAKRKEMEKQGIDAGEEPEPTIPSELEVIRLAICWSRGDTAGMARSARRIGERMDEQLVALAKRQTPYERVTPEQEELFRTEAAHHVLMARLWSPSFVQPSAVHSPMGIGVLAARLFETRETRTLASNLKSLKEPNRLGRLTGPALARFEGLLALRQGVVDHARRRLEEAGDDPLARLALGMIHERTGDKRSAILAYASLALEMPQRVVGCAARRRLEHILGRALEPTPAARALDLWAKRFAPWLDDMARNPTLFMTLSAKHAETRIDPFHRVALKVTLRNVARIPMSVGPDLSLSSRILLTPYVVVRGRDVSSLVESEVLELDRRLKLMPGEMIEATIYPSRGSLGVWLDRFADKAASVRWRAIQGYWIDQNKRFVEGPISLSAVSDMLIRDSIPARSDVNDIVAAIAQTQGRAFLEAVLHALIVGGSNVPNEPKEALDSRRELLAGAFASRWPTLSDPEKVYVLASLGRIGLPAMTRAILDAARDDPSPLVQAALIIDAYRDPDDPGLIRLTESTDTDLREMAIALRARLHQGAARPEPSTTQSDPP